VRVTRVQHVSVNVEHDLDASVAFYTDVLGLERASRPEIPGVGGAWFSVDDAQLHLVDAAPGDAPIRPRDHHFCFYVDDLDGAIAELDARGVAYVRGSQGPVVQIWVVDPAGNTVELQQDPALR
jgi:lactoylglutathione lyase